MIKKVSILLVVLALTMILSTQVLGATSSGVSLSLINQNPYPASAGDLVEVRIGVENYGNTLNDFNLELVDDYPFTIVSDKSQIISTLNSYQEGDSKEILTYKLKVEDSTPSGTYDLVLRYSDSSSNAIVQTTLSLEISSDDAAEVHIDKTVLIPGKETKIIFKITNTGSSSLKDLTFSFENPEKAILPVGSDNTQHIDFISAGQSEEISYLVVADTTVDPGLYELSLNLEYQDDYASTNIQTTTAGIYVGGETSFLVALSEMSGSELTFSIANIGSNPAYSVLVTLPSQEGLFLSGSNSQIVGNLNNGDYTLASFTGSFSSNNPLEIKVSYTDTRGERIEIIEEVSLSSSSSKSATRTLPNGMTQEDMQEMRSRKEGNPMMVITNPNSDSKGISSLLRNTLIVLVILALVIFGLKKYKNKKVNKGRKVKVKNNF